MKPTINEEGIQFKSLSHKIAYESEMRRRRYVNFDWIYEMSKREGFKEGEKYAPQEMIVLQDGEEIDRIIAGVCGMAGVLIKPASISFVKWLKKEFPKEGHKHYYGGFYIPVHAHGQSYERKMVHARKMAKVLREQLKINARASGRLD